MDTWPPLPYADWEPTKQTLRRYAQVVGKIRIALVPFRNHWWHVTLLPATRGLTTGSMPAGDRNVEIIFDVLDHRLLISTSDGQERLLELGWRPACADFYRELFAALHELAIRVDIRADPFDLGASPAFADDTTHASYDADAVTRYWRILAGTEHVLGSFVSRFNGRASPVRLFWPAFDLAHARYSGRPAAVPPGADRVTAEAYSHEVIAFGFGPGDERRTSYPAFYSYTAPEPAQLREKPLAPASAQWQDTGSGSLAILPYDAVRAANESTAMLLAFYQSAYDAGAAAANWNTEAFDTGIR